MTKNKRAYQGELHRRDASILGYQPGEAELFSGQYKHIMPAMRAANLTPLSPAHIMDMRNKAFPAYWNDIATMFTAKFKGFNEEPHSLLWNENFLYTDFGIVTVEDDIYLFPQSEFLRNITPESKWIERSIPLVKEDLRSAKRHNRKEFQKFWINDGLTLDELIQNPIMLDIADGDQERLAQYANNMIALRQKEHAAANNMKYASHQKKDAVRFILDPNLNIPDRASRLTLGTSLFGDSKFLLQPLYLPGAFSICIAATIDRAPLWGADDNDHYPHIPMIGFREALPVKTK